MYHLFLFRRLIEKSRMFAHKKLDAWKDSMILVEDVYLITSCFPKSELFGLSSQIRRSAVSVPANISEGAARNRPKEFIRFIRFSFGSLSELETHLEISYRLRFIDENTFVRLQNKITKISAQLSGLIRSIEKKIV
jgi:four helix bundle protein